MRHFKSGRAIGLAAFILILSAGVAGAQEPLRSTVFPSDSVRVRKGANANQRSIVDTLTPILSKLEMHETTLTPGQSPHPPHRHAHEELMIVKSGVLEVLQGNRTRPAKTGDVIFMGSNELHGLKNVGQVNSTYLVIRIDPHDLPPDAPSPTTTPARGTAPR
jgi:quercetin dioxygenase-like cupin family protein